MDKYRYRQMLLMQAKIQQEHVQACKYLNLAGSSSQNYDWLLRQRLFEGEPTLRSFFTFVVFQYLEDRSPLELEGPERRFFTQQLPYITEVLISVQYYQNHALDLKCGVRDFSDAHKCMLWANRLRSFLGRYIEQAVPAAYTPQLRLAINRIFDAVDLGQQMEWSCCQYEHWKSYREMLNAHQQQADRRVDAYCIDLMLDISTRFFDRNKHQFLRRYWQRIYLTNAALYEGVAALIAQLLEVDDRKIRRFSALFGLMKQLINDIADFVPASADIGTQTRRPADAFADLRSYNVTLPTMLLLRSNAKTATRQWLEGGLIWNSALERRIANESVAYFTIFRAMSLSRRVRDAALSHLKDDNPMVTMLYNICSVADVNKFFRYFDRKNRYRKAYRKLRKAS